MPDNYAQTGEGLLLICNGIDAPLVWQGEGNVANPAGLYPPETAAAGTGSGVGALTGTYYCYVTYIRDDGFESAMSPISSSIILNTNLQIDYTAIPVGTDPRIVGRRIYRNTNGQLRTVYLDVEIGNNIDTTATSTLEDSILSARLAFPLFDSNNLDRTQNNYPPPDTKPFACTHLGRTYYFGFAEYSEGSCEVTIGTAIVQGRGTKWKSNWAGRFIYVESGVYEIDSVDETLQQITLTEVYTGATNLFASYCVRPAPAECSLLYYSEVNNPEAVNPVHSLTVPEEEDIGTGLMSMYGFLYVLKRKSIYRFTVGKDPLRDGALYPANNRGAINQRCVVVVADVAYIMDDRGVYRFSGGQDAQEIGNQIQDLFRDGPVAINWMASRYFHAAYSPAESCIRWFVALRGDLFPRHALCYSYILNRWWIEPYHRPVAASCLGFSGRIATGWGKAIEQAFYGMDCGEIMAPVQESPDVIAAPATATGAVTAADVNSVTSDLTASSDMVGAPIVHRPKDRSLQGYLQTRRIVSVSGQTIVVTPPWIMIPEEGDEIIPGGFPWQYQTHEFKYVTKENTDERSLEVTFEPNPGSIMDMAISNNGLVQQNNATILSIANGGVGYARGRKAIRAELKHDEGTASTHFDGLLEGNTEGRKRVSITLTGVGGNARDVLQQIVVKGVSG